MSARGKDFVFFQSAKLQNRTIFILIGTNIYHGRKAFKPNQTKPNRKNDNFHYALLSVWFGLGNRIRKPPRKVRNQRLSSLVISGIPLSCLAYQVHRPSCSCALSFLEVGCCTTAGGNDVRCLLYILIIFTDDFLTKR